MTENHSEFSQESGVEPSGDVGQKPAQQNDPALSDTPSVKPTNCVRIPSNINI